MADLRDALAEAFESVDTELPAGPAAEPPASPLPVEQQPQPAPADDRARDETGRFVAKAGEPPVAAPVAPSAPIDAPQQIQRPSTWKKEYWPLYDKLAQGQTLLPEEAKKLADYTNERENQFKSGVSTYKAEADRSREIQEAIAPFVPELQRHGITPGKWVANLVAAHRVLAFGSPADRAQMIARMAAEYQVPLGDNAPSQQTDPQMQWLSQNLQRLQGEIGQFKTQAQQREQQDLQSQIERIQNEKDAHGKPLRPHFETVREQMAGLLQAGMAQSLEDAYAKAVRLNDQLWEQQRILAAPAGRQAADAVAKAKAAAISPKSASPRASDEAQPKGRRETLAAQLEGIVGSGRV